MAEFQGHLNKTFTAEEFSITFRKTVPLPLPTTGPVPSYLLLYLCTLPKYVLMHSFPIPVLPVWWHWHLHTYKAFQAVSTRLWPSLFFFFFFFHSSICYRWTQKKWLTRIFRFFRIFLWQQWSKSSWNSGRYRFFWNLHHKFFDEKENFCN